MSSRLLNARIETALTLAVAALAAFVIGAGTLDMGRTYSASPARVATVRLEPVVITSSRVRVAAPAQMAQSADSANAL